MAAEVDPTIAKVGASVAGALVSLKFVKGVTFTERVLNATTALASSYYITPLATKYLHIEGRDEGYAIAFLIGSFGVMIMAKVHEGITTLEIKRITNGLIERIFKR